MTDFRHTQSISDPHGSHRKMLHVLLTHLPPRYALTFSPTPEGQAVKAVMDSARGFDLLGESVPKVRVSARTLALLGFFQLFIHSDSLLSGKKYLFCTHPECSLKKYIYILFAKKPGVRINDKLKKSQKGKSTCQDSNLRHRFA